jgi:TatD DNase family protein
MVADAQVAGVERFVTVGTDVPRSAAALAAAGRHPGVVWATVGLHPHDAKLGLDGLAEMLAAPGVVAVGECGLDYHYEHSPRATQREAFAAQIGWAHERGLALMVHTREA